MAVDILLYVFIAGTILLISFILAYKFFFNKSISRLFAAEIGASFFIFTVFILFVSFTTNDNLDGRLSGAVVDGLDDNYGQPAQQDSSAGQPGTYLETQRALVAPEQVILEDEEISFDIIFYNNYDKPLESVFFRFSRCFDSEKTTVDAERNIAMLANDPFITLGERVEKTLYLKDIALEKGDYVCTLSACIKDDCISGEAASADIILVKR